MRIKTRTPWLLLGLLVTGHASDRAAASSPTLNSKTYTSPSGRYALKVTPGDLYGRGKGSYAFSADGKVVWSGEKPYTLWDARVTDDGVVAGYSYSNGWEGFSEAGFGAGMGDFRVVILDPRGAERLNQPTQREFSPFPHRPPNPLASGLVLDTAHDRGIVRVADEDLNRQTESWWPFELSTGKALARFRPKELMAEPESARYVMDAQSVPETPLFLLHWYCYPGARFTLIGQDGKAVWSRDLPDDYHAAGNHEAWERLMASVHRTGGILESRRERQFALRFVKDAQRVTFAVAPGAGGTWTVTEVDRRPFVETPAATPEPDPVPALALRRLGQVVLNGPTSGPEPEVRGVRDFVIDGHGRIAFLRGSRDRTHRWSSWISGEPSSAPFPSIVRGARTGGRGGPVSRALDPSGTS